MPELLPEFDSPEMLRIVALLARSDAYRTATAIAQQLGIAEDVVHANCGRSGEQQRVRNHAMIRRNRSAT